MRTSAVDIKKLQTSDSLQKVSIFRVQNHVTKKIDSAASAEFENGIATL